MDPADEGKIVLERERQKASFSTREMTFLLYGGKEKTERREQLIKIIENDPVFRKDDRHFLSRSEFYKRCLEKGITFESRMKQLGIRDLEERAICRTQVDEIFPFDVHNSMFVPTLASQTTDEQRKKWLPKAIKHEILGAYAQTELGHGSNVRGLETTATYDKDTQEFILNSPTLTSTKWWPGGLGKTANFCVAHARLLIEDKDYGVHTFIVQLRDLKTHIPLNGITCGDIGPKYGFNSIDNGYLRFNNVRIPRDQMLMKYAKVMPDGTYVHPIHDKLGYGTMLLIRAMIVANAGATLARACTITTRYSAVRRQGSRGVSTGENQVLDYTMQQAQLFPKIATAFAYHFTGACMKKMYLDLMQGINSGDLNMLPEVHATSAGLKALVTYDVTDSIELVRRLCGGHGYSDLSGLTILLRNYAANCTLEGTREVLVQQTARYLMKAFKSARTGGKLVGNVRYLERLDSILSINCSARNADDLLNPEVQLEIFAARAARATANAAAMLDHEMKANQVDYDEAWNANGTEWLRCSDAHCQYTVVLNFINAVKEVDNPRLQRILKTLCDLYVLSSIDKKMGEFRDGDFISSEQASWVTQQIRVLLKKLRPDAVALVDSWAFTDAFLDSSLGKYDGDVYRSLYERAQKDPLNQNVTPPGYEEYIRPQITAKL
eukprot:GFYU01002321.1.p1 GENE.GFYU01002321.1~~GFYU01002321.1.p1  ORF type:complete len:688 (+),score=205.75 GFYU01002321.1:70-2064(+)